MAGKELHAYNEAGRRVIAALLSYQLGRASVDRILKEVPEDVGERWAGVARQFLVEMAAHVGKFDAMPKGPIRIK